MVIVKCGICKRVRVRGRWMEPDRLISEAIVSYTCCPDCRQKIFTSRESPADAIFQIQES